MAYNNYGVLAKALVQASICWTFSEVRYEDSKKVWTCNLNDSFCLAVLTTSNHNFMGFFVERGFDIVLIESEDSAFFFPQF